MILSLFVIFTIFDYSSFYLIQVSFLPYLVIQVFNLIWWLFKFFKRFNDTLQFSFQILCNSPNLLNRIQNFNRLRIRIVTDGEGTGEICCGPFADFFLGGTEGIGDKVKWLIICNWIFLIGSFFRIKCNFYRFIRKSVLQKT